MDQFLIVDGEYFTQTPAEQLGKMEVFLGVTPVLKNGYYHHDPEYGRFCARLTSEDLDVNKHESVCIEKEKYGLSRKYAKLAGDILEALHLFYAPHMKTFSSISNVTFQWLN